MMARLLPYIIAVLTLLCASPVLAQAGIEVELNKGQMLRLDRTASSIMIADPSIADVQVISPKLVYVHGKKVGETSIFAIDAQDMMILNTEISVTHNLSRLSAAMQDALPGNNIEFSTTDGGLMARGNVASPLEAETVKSLAASFMGGNDKFINLLKVDGSDQVMLQVKVAEISRNELKRFGINMQNIVTSGNFRFDLLQGRSFLSGASPTRGSSDGSLFGSFNDGQNSINGIIDALETQGLITVLAEPSLTATSGKTANFLAGGEYPVPVADANGGISINYKQYGVGLDFTPTVLSKERISLTVSPEVSTVDEINTLQTGTALAFPIPSLQTRRATTTVELGSGQSFAIAGLLKNDRNNSISKFPGLGDLPVLGPLFRSQQFRNDQSELVIIVTPYIVRPVSTQLATPLDGYEPASDLERILSGKLYHETPPPAPHEALAPSAGMDEMRLYGEAGFMTE